MPPSATVQQLHNSVTSWRRHHQFARGAAAAARRGRSREGLDLRLEPVDLRLEHRELGFDGLPVGERGLEPAREVAVLGVDLSFEVLPLLLGDSNISLKVQEIDVGGVRGQDCSRKGQAQQREARGSPHHHPKGSREVCGSRARQGSQRALGGFQAAQRSQFQSPDGP